MGSLASPAARAGDDSAETTAFHAIAPCRLSDSRLGQNSLWLDPTHVRVQVTGRCDVPDEARSVAIGIVAVDASADGFVVAFPAGDAQPSVSTLNYTPGQIRTNATVVQLGGGSFDLVTTGRSQLVVDITGYFSPAASASEGRFVPMLPTRLVDTRDRGPAGGPAAAGDRLDVSIAGVPADAAAVAVNLTATNTAAAGFITAWAAGAKPPDTSVLNYDGAAETRAVTTILPIGPLPDGSGMGISVMATIASADLVVDVTGYFTGPSAPVSADGLFVPAAMRLLDTREAGTPLYPMGATEIAMPAAAAGVVVNTTMIAAVPGWLRDAPAGVPSGPTSSVNGGADDTRIVANMSVVPISDRGVEVLSMATAHVVVDLIGYFTGTPMTASLPPRPAVRPPTPSATGYPTGRCDAMNSPGLNDDRAAPVEVRQIGTSVEGRPINAEYWGPVPAARTVSMIGQIHGNECAPAVLVEYVRHHPPTTFGIWLIPTLNPDGYAAYTRQNAHGTDLNTDGQRQWEPETQALMAFTAAIQPVLTVHVHSPNGQAGWYGTDAYRAGDPGASGAPLSSAIARRLQSAGLTYGGAGSRSNSNWFLWQGQRSVWPHQESILIELHAISDEEVPTATPRPPTRSVPAVQAEAAAVMAALDAVIG